MDSIDTDSGDLVEVGLDIDEDVLLASDSHSTSYNLSESNEIDNLLDEVNDLSDEVQTLIQIQGEVYRKKIQVQVQIQYKIHIQRMSRMKI